MIIGKEEAGRYLAQCQLCGQWQEVQPRLQGAEVYFACWQAEFTCCGIRQTVHFAVEKDEIDFH